MIPQITQLWDYIGTAWTDFQDKDLIENFWSALASGNQYLYNHVANVQFSRTIDMMYPTYNYGPETFFIVYSGTSSEINVTLVFESVEQILNGDFEVSLSGWNTNYGVGTVTRFGPGGAHTGAWCMQLGAKGAALYNLGGQYLSSTVTAWFYISAAFTPKFGEIGLDLVDMYGNILETASADPGILNAWQKLTIYTQTAGIRGLVVRNLNNQTTVWVDDVSIRCSGLFEYFVPEYTYAIPTISYNYKYNGVSYSGLYTQGIDYLISSDMNSLIWINKNIIGDRRFATTGVIIGTADNLYRINPVLCNVWAKQCGLNIKTHFPRYLSFNQDRYKHLKMLIWSLDYYQNQVPSIYTLRNAFGIARGLPFAYESGIMSYSTINGLYNVTIGEDTFIFPSGAIRPGPIGYYDKFEVLASGLDLYDYATNSAIVSSYTSPYTRRSTLIYDLDATLSGISFSQDFLDTYMAKIIPEQIQYLII